MFLLYMLLWLIGALLKSVRRISCLLNGMRRPVRDDAKCHKFFKSALYSRVGSDDDVV